MKQRDQVCVRTSWASIFWIVSQAGRRTRGSFIDSNMALSKSEVLLPITCFSIYFSLHFSDTIEVLAGEICFQFMLSCNGRVKHEGVQVWVGLEVAKSRVEIVPNKKNWYIGRINNNDIY